MGFSLITFIKSIGYIGVFSVIFTESGILFGVVLPGDSLLFTVGVLCAQGFFNIWWMSIGCFVAAFTGNLVGYEIGKRLGIPFAKKYASRHIRESQIIRMNKFFESHGILTLVLARFIPVARTLAPFVAGVIRMDYRDFLIYSAAGALVWGVGLPVLGYSLGHLIPDDMIDLFIWPIIGIVICFVAYPYVAERWAKKRGKTYKASDWD